MSMSHVGFRVGRPTSRGAWGMPRHRKVSAETLHPVAGGPFEVLLARLDSEPAATDELAWCLCDAERARAGRFVFERDRRRFVAGRARLRHLLALRLGTRADAVEFDYGPRGKPRLGGRFAGSGLRFNVSHCGDVALYAISTGHEIGVDIEAVRELEHADGIAAQFFSRRENEAYRALDTRDRAQAFFKCWTRKEAFIKALGDGLYYPLDAFDVSLAPEEPAAILRVGDVAGAACGWALHDLDPGVEPRFAAAVVVGNRR